MFARFAPLVLAALSGCAAQSYTDARLQAREGVSSLVTPSKGLIFGERCGGGGFMIGSKADGSPQLVPGWDEKQKYFFLSLPPGEYTLSLVGSSHGAHVGRPPYRFNAVAGKATYVGSFLPAWGDAGNAACVQEWRKSISARPYTRTGIFGNDITYDVHLLNRADATARGLEAAYPNVKLGAFEIELAR